MITVKEYANSRQITPQSVYGLINRHKTELKDCIVKKKGVKNITPKGVEILDKLKADKMEIVESTVIIDNQLEDELKRLREKVEKLQDEKEVLQAEIIKLKDNENSYLQQLLEVKEQLLIEQQKPKKEKSFLQKLFNKNHDIFSQNSMNEEVKNDGENQL